MLEVPLIIRPQDADCPPDSPSGDTLNMMILLGRSSDAVLNEAMPPPTSNYCANAVLNAAAPRATPPIDFYNADADMNEAAPPMHYCAYADLNDQCAETQVDDDTAPPSPPSMFRDSIEARCAETQLDETQFAQTQFDDPDDPDMGP